MNESSQEPNFNIIACEKKELLAEAWIRNFVNWKLYRAAILSARHSMYYMCINMHEILLQNFGTWLFRVKIFFATEKQSMVLYCLLYVN